MKNKKDTATIYNRNYGFVSYDHRGSRVNVSSFYYPNFQNSFSWAIKMKTIKKIVLSLIAAVFFSCINQQMKNPKTEFNSSDTVKAVSVDSGFLDKNEVNSNEWKSDSVKRKSPMQVELDNALKDESIDNYYKEIFQTEKLILADDIKMLSITDSLFTKDAETDLFYFIVFTKSMNGSDGFYIESIGLSALDFITKKTECFATYFYTAPKLTEKDMDNWADHIYDEIQISRENEDENAINELENKLLENITGTRKEYKPVIEKLIERIKKAHNDV